MNDENQLSEAFVAGFMSKCAEAGLSQKQAVALLVKRAADGAETDAGIGTFSDNALYTDKQDGIVANQPMSYYGRLAGNLSSKDTTKSAPAASLWWSRPRAGKDGERYITNGTLSAARTSQAYENLANGGLYPAGSVPGYAVINNLRNAGAKNHEAYLRSGAVPKRTTLDRTGIENLTLTPEQEKMLLEMQNTMAQNRRAAPAYAMA